MAQLDSLIALRCAVSGSDRSAYLADAAAPRALTTVLAGVPNLDAPDPPSQATLGSGPTDPVQIARAYGVDACVTCSLKVEALRPSSAPITVVERPSAKEEAALLHERGRYHSDLYNYPHAPADAELAEATSWAPLALAIDGDVSESWGPSRR